MLSLAGPPCVCGNEASGKHLVVTSSRVPNRNLWKILLELNTAANLTNKLTAILLIVDALMMMMCCGLFGNSCHLHHGIKV